MLSRVAEAVYWMHRYIERAENVARFVHVNLHLLLDADGHSGGEQWLPLVTTSGDHEDFAARYGEPSEDKVIRFLTFDTANPNSIISCFRMARENARSIRDTISSEMWNHINQTYLMIEKESRRRRIRDLLGFYSGVKNASHFLIGLAETTMSHNEAWHFGRLGRVLERADKTARILDVRYFILLPSIEYVDSPYDSILWKALLKSTSAFEMYHKAHPHIHHENVADFLIFDREFPRSLNWCVTDAQRSMAWITERLDSKPQAAVALETLVETLRHTDVHAVLADGLHEFIDRFQYKLNIVGREIFYSFFTLRDAAAIEAVQSQTQA